MPDHKYGHPPIYSNLKGIRTLSEERTKTNVLNLPNKPETFHQSNESLNETRPIYIRRPNLSLSRYLTLRNTKTLSEELGELLTLKIHTT